MSFVIKESRERSVGARQNFSAIICFACKWDDTVSAFNPTQFSREEHNNIGEGGNNWSNYVTIVLSDIERQNPQT